MLKGNGFKRERSCSEAMTKEKDNSSPEAKPEARLDPWSSSIQIEDYERLIRDFGLERFDPKGLPHPSRIFRRGVVFAHRGFDYVKRAIDGKMPFAILSGLMPSGPFHLGKKMVLDQVLYFQSLGADIFLLVADIEAYATRNVPFEKAREYAIENYILYYIALGLKPDHCQIYLQSKRTAVKDIGYTMGKKVNWSTMKAIYGFGDQTNMAHVFSPLVQVGDILHVQLEKYGGPRPTVVPVGVDQDPHIRLTRDIAAAFRTFNVMKAKDGRIGVFVKVDEDVDKLIDLAKATVGGMGFKKIEAIPKYKALYINDAKDSDIIPIDEKLIKIEKERGGYAFFPPCGTYHRLMTGLTGGKMSSSVPQSAIFLTDTPEEAASKIKTCKTGGGMSIEEHKKHGGKPDRCSVYELFLYHFIDDDKELATIFENCKSGQQLCGQCKKLAQDKIKEFFKDLKERKEAARDQVKDFLVDD
jgi:tryptophanyl-tRNA synthetase